MTTKLIFFAGLSPPTLDSDWLRVAQLIPNSAKT